MNDHMTSVKQKEPLEMDEATKKAMEESLKEHERLYKKLGKM